MSDKTREGFKYVPEGAAKYGNNYFCVHSKSGTIRVMADDVRVLPDGSAVFLRIYKWIEGVKEKLDTPETNMAFAPGEWSMFYAASLIDGGAIAVEHWDAPATSAGAAKRKGRA